MKELYNFLAGNSELKYTSSVNVISLAHVHFITKVMSVAEENLTFLVLLK